MWWFAAQSFAWLADASVDGSAVRPWMVVLGVVGLLLLLAVWAIGVRYIPNNRVGVVEKLWSSKGSVPAGGILALRGEAGYQVGLIRGGVHFGLWRWQYRIHKIPLVTIPQGKIGYVYARGRRAPVAQPDAGPGHRLQQLPGRRPVPGRRQRHPRPAGPPAGHPA